LKFLHACTYPSVSLVISTSEDGDTHRHRNVGVSLTTSATMSVLLLIMDEKQATQKPCAIKISQPQREREELKHCLRTN
jgi:hypothetical protein